MTGVPSIIQAGMEFAAANRLVPGNGLVPGDPPYTGTPEPDYEEEVSERNAAEEEVTAQKERQSKIFAELLAPRRFDIFNPPPAAVPIYKLGAATIATPGNIEGIQAQAKSGKTALVGAMHGAAMGGGGDCLGVTSENLKRHALLHFDTEQSAFDHHRVSLTALRRAALAEPPPWYRSYRLVGVSHSTRRQLIPFEMERARATHGGIHSVFLDGLADFISDPNDPTEALGFIDELHGFADRYNTVVICIIHENPGSEIGKTRGHLGSQLERRAESNIRLAKDGDVVTVYTERSRGAHVPKDLGPRFRWDEVAKMHVSAQTAAADRYSAKQRKHDELVAAIYKTVPTGMGLEWATILDQIASLLGIKREGARRHFDAMRDAGLIYKKGEMWARR